MGARRGVTAQPEPLHRGGTEGGEGRRREEGDAWLYGYMAAGQAAKTTGWIRVDEPAERMEDARMDRWNEIDQKWLDSKRIASGKGRRGDGWKDG